MTLKDTALRAAVLKALVDLVKDESDTARLELQTELSEVGAASVKVTLPSGEHVATITLAGGKPAARVIDERAFLAWAEGRGQTETRVREAFRKRVLDVATKQGAPVDEHGEVVPGVELFDGSVYVSQRFTSEGRALIADAWRAGELPSVMRALT